MNRPTRNALWAFAIVLGLVAWYAFPDEGTRVVICAAGAVLVYSLNLAHETLQSHTAQLKELDRKVSLLDDDKRDREFRERLEKTDFFTVRK